MSNNFVDQLNLVGRRGWHGNSTGLDTADLCLARWRSLSLSLALEQYFQSLDFGDTVKA